MECSPVSGRRSKRTLTLLEIANGMTYADLEFLDEPLLDCGADFQGHPHSLSDESAPISTAANDRASHALVVADPSNRRFESQQDFEERLRRQKEKQQLLIQQLQQQLEELEAYAQDSQQRASELQSQFDPSLAEKQTLLIAELKSQLDLKISNADQLSLEEFRSEIGTAVARVRQPIRSKEEQIRYLTAQVADLERFVEFLRNDEQRASSAAPTSEDLTDGRPEANAGHLLDGMDAQRTSKKKHKAQARRSKENSRPTSNYRPFGYLTWLAGVVSIFGHFRKRDEHPSYSEHLQQLHRAVNDVITLLAAQSNNSTEADVGSATVRSSTELTAVVRMELGSAIMALFHHGIAPPQTRSGLVPIWHGLGCALPATNFLPTPNSKTHCWHVFEYFYALKLGDKYNSSPHRTLSTAFQVDLAGGVATTPKQMLFDDILKIQSSHEPHKKSADCKFRSLVCAALNRRQLAAWCQMVARSSAVVDQFYHPWSYVAQRGFSEAVGCLERLSELHFSLPTDFPIRQLNSISEVFADPM